MMLVILFYVTEKVVASGFSKCFFNILPEKLNNCVGYHVNDDDTDISGL